MKMLLSTVAITGLCFLVFGIVSLFAGYDNRATFTCIAIGFGMAGGSYAIAGLLGFTEENSS